MIGVVWRERVGVAEGGVSALCRSDRHGNMVVAEGRRGAGRNVEARHLGSGH